ncbi:MAG: hypothetical protein IKZ87_02085 [Actinomycetaceae bacterium]|nr:hypothetical protein [Actinomycetaceae bacterium]
MKESMRLVVVGVVVACMVLVSAVIAYVGGREEEVSSPVPTAYPSSSGNPLDYVDAGELDRLIQNPDDEYVTYVLPPELLVETGPPSVVKNYSDDLEGKIQRIRDEGCDCVDVKADEETGSLVFTFTQEQRRERMARTIRFAHVNEDIGTVKMSIAQDFRKAKLLIKRDSYSNVPLILMWQEGLTEGMAYVQLLAGNSDYEWRVDWVDEDSGRVVMSFDSVSEHGHVMRHCGGGCVETYGGRFDITQEYWQSLFDKEG